MMVGSLIKTKGLTIALLALGRDEREGIKGSKFESTRLSRPAVITLSS